MDDGIEDTSSCSRGILRYASVLFYAGGDILFRNRRRHHYDIMLQVRRDLTLSPLHYQNSYFGVVILHIGIIYLPNEPATIGSGISICLSDAC